MDDGGHIRCPTCQAAVNPEDSQSRLPTTSSTPASHLMIVGICFTVLMAVGGWVWFLAGQTEALADVRTHVAAIEDANRGRDMQIYSMSERLARMEPMLQVIVDSVLAKPGAHESSH